MYICICMYTYASRDTRTYTNAGTCIHIHVHGSDGLATCTQRAYVLGHEYSWGSVGFM